MSNIIYNIKDWFLDSNRWKHYGLGIVYGLAADDTYCAVYGGAGVSLALEWKDGQWGGQPDWVDASITFAGVMTGFVIRKLTSLWIC